MDIIAEHGTLLVLVAGFFGFWMAFGVGANDVANAMGTSVGSKAITIKQAIFIAMIFEVGGAYLAGGEVTATIRKGIVAGDAFAGHPELLVYCMLAALMAAGIWLITASFLGWPVSTTHSIVGAIIGTALLAVGPEAVVWSKTLGIVGSWIVTPLLAGFIAFWVFRSAEVLVLNHNDPVERAKRWVPFYMGLAAFVVVLVTITKGLKHVGLHIDTVSAYLLAAGLSVVVGFIGSILVKKIKFEQSEGKSYDNVEKIFAYLMIVTACCMAFAHGSNDVANAVGPLAAVVGTIDTVMAGGVLGDKIQMAWWILPLGAVGIGVGLGILGARVIATIGGEITHLTPTRGFAAELAAATTVIIASGTGMPISTTQTLVGAVLGVGLARGVAALNMRVVGKIFMSWVITLPTGALLAMICYWLLRSIFG